MQCWAEVSPRQQSHGNKMTPNAWETLDGVLKVLQLLWRWMEQTDAEVIVINVYSLFVRDGTLTWPQLWPHNLRPAMATASALQGVSKRSEQFEKRLKLKKYEGSSHHSLLLR